MDGNTTALTAGEVSTIRAAIRAGRVLAPLGLLLGMPWLIEAVAPVVGVALLTVILLSPLLVSGLLVLAAWKGGRERRQATA